MLLTKAFKRNKFKSAHAHKDWQVPSGTDKNKGLLSYERGYIAIASGAVHAIMLVLPHVCVCVCVCVRAPQFHSELLPTIRTDTNVSATNSVST
jgi:hypothetical protein